MENQANTILSALNAFANGYSLSIALALAGSGTIAMTVLQVIKELTPFRRWYQQRWICAWISKKIDDLKKIDNLKALIDERSIRDPNFNLDAANVEKLMVEFVTGGNSNACFELPIEELISHLQDAKVSSINYPHLSLPFFLVISQGVSFDDVRALLTYSESHSGNSNAPIPIDQRDRIAHRMQRNLRGIEISLGQNWRWMMQFVSIIVTTIIVEYIVWNYADTQHHFTTMIYALPLATVSGYIAPIARDLVAAMEKLRYAR